MFPNFSDIFPLLITLVLLVLIFNLSYFLYRLTDLFFKSFRKD